MYDGAFAHRSLRAALIGVWRIMSASKVHLGLVNSIVDV